MAATGRDFLSILEAAVADLTAGGKRLAADAVGERETTLFEDTEKRASLAGALLVTNDGGRLAVPHSHPVHAGKLRVSKSAATVGCDVMTALDMSAQIAGAWLGLLSVPAGVAPPSAAYVPPTFGVAPNEFTVELVQEDGLSQAVVVSAAGVKATEK